MTKNIYSKASKIFQDKNLLNLFNSFIKNNYDLPERFNVKWNKNQTVKDRLLLLNEYIAEEKPVKIIHNFMKENNVQASIDEQDICLSSHDVLTLLKQGIPDITLEFKRYIANSDTLDYDILKRVKGANTYESVKSILDRYGVDRHTFMGMCDAFSKTPKFINLSEKYLALKQQIYDDLDGSEGIDKEQYYSLLNSVSVNKQLKHDLLRYLDQKITFPTDKRLDKTRLFKQFADFNSIGQLHKTLQKTKSIAVSAAKPELVEKKFNTEIATFFNKLKENIMSEQTASFSSGINRADFKPNTRIVYNANTVRDPNIYLGTIKNVDLNQCDIKLDNGAMVTELWEDFGARVLACSNSFAPYTSSIPISEVMSWVDVTKWQSKTLRNLLQSEQLLKELENDLYLTRTSSPELNPSKLLFDYGDMDIIQDDPSCNIYSYVDDDDYDYDDYYYDDYEDDEDDTELSSLYDIELSSTWDQAFIQEGDKVIINTGTLKSPYFEKGEVYDVDSTNKKIDVYLFNSGEIVTESVTNGGTGIIGFCRKLKNETTSKITLDTLKSFLDMDEWVANRAITEYNLSNKPEVLETRIIKMNADDIENFDIDVNELLSDYIDTDQFRVNLSPRFAYSVVDYKDAKAALVIGVEDYKNLDFYLNPNNAINSKLDSIYDIDEELTEKTKVLLRVDVKELDPKFIEFDIEDEFINYKGVIDESYLDIVQVKF